MINMLLPAIIAITLALILYTLGVFSERKHGTLTKKNLSLFWLGLVCDTTGTSLMAKIATSHQGSVAASSMALHAITGGAAIVLMLTHALWATWVYFKGTEKTKAQFHRFSSTVWCFWLIPYVCGLLIGTPQIPIKGMPAFLISVVFAAIVGALLYASDKRKAAAKKN